MAKFLSCKCANEVFIALNYDIYLEESAQNPSSIQQLNMFCMNSPQSKRKSGKVVACRKLFKCVYIFN